MAERKKAEELLAEAKKKQGGGSVLGRLFGSSSKSDEVVDLLQKAGGYFKVAQAWKEAGDVYYQAAEICYKTLKDKITATQAYVEAGNCYRKVNGETAIENYQKGIEIYIDMGRITIAARHAATVAEIYEKDLKNTIKAIEYYQKAADYYKGEESKSNSNKYLLKIAELSAINEDYKKSMNIFEDVGMQCLDSALLKYSVKDYFFKACVVGLCYDSLEAQKIYDRSCEAASSFKDSRESVLIKEILRSIDEGDVQIFTAALQKHDAVSRIDDWTTKLLLRVKKPMEGFVDIT